MSSLRNEAVAARQLLQELAAAQAEPLDDETVDIAVDSETGLKEAISRAILQMRLAYSDANSCADLANKIISRSQRHDRRAQRIKDSIAMAMSFAGVEKLALPEATLTLSERKRGVVIADGSAIPDSFVKTETVRKIEKAAILKALTAGETVPGATLDNGGQTLTIRTK